MMIYFITGASSGVLLDLIDFSLSLLSLLSEVLSTLIVGTFYSSDFFGSIS